MHASGSLRIIAAFEAAKGLLVLLCGFGALALLHRDVQHVAAQLVAHLHLNAAKRFPRIFLDAAAGLTDSHLWLLAALAAAYAIVRFVEAYGLWLRRRWAEWFAALSAAIYLPFEVYELLATANWLAAGALVLNVAIIAAMAGSLRRPRAACGISGA